MAVACWLWLPYVVVGPWCVPPPSPFASRWRGRNGGRSLLVRCAASYYHEIMARGLRRLI